MAKIKLTNNALIDLDSLSIMPDLDNVLAEIDLVNNNDYTATENCIAYLTSTGVAMYGLKKQSSDSITWLFSDSASATEYTIIYLRKGYILNPGTNRTVKIKVFGLA